MSKSMQRLSVRVARLSVQAFETSVAASVTIAARAPILYSGAHNAADAAEARRMVVEKMEAVVECATAANLAIMGMWTRALFGGVRGPAALGHELADIATAATLPMRSRVRANARRLVTR